MCVCVFCCCCYSLALLSSIELVKHGKSAIEIKLLLLYRVSAGIDWPSVSIRLLGEIESLICNCHLSVVDMCNRYIRAACQPL